MNPHDYLEIGVCRPGGDLIPNTASDFCNQSAGCLHTYSRSAD
jgi:hypothetical protein